jgi:hypothetical protein
MIRLADALLNISGEIMAENFAPATLLAMSQTELPKQEDVLEQHNREAMAQIQKLHQQAAMPPQEGQPPPDPAQLEQAKQGIVAKAQEEIAKVVTVEKVFGFLRDQKTRPFVLMVATDSTIQPDENAEKQARSEFGQAFAQITGALAPLIQASPEAAPFAGEMLKFMLAPFRVGRQMDQAIDDFVEQMTEKAKQPPPPNPDQVKAEAEAEKIKIENARSAAEFEDKKAERASKDQDDEAKRQRELEDRAMRMRDEERKSAEADRKAQHDAMMRQVDLALANIAMQTERLKIFAAAEQADMQRHEKQQKELQASAKEQEREGRETSRQAEGEAKASRRDEAINAALASLAQGLETVASAQQAVAESLAKPKTIKFNAEGRPVGIQ